MELILLEKVTNLGRVGDKVVVKPGYARNFLIPKKKAIFATPENIKNFEAKRAEFEKFQEDKLENARRRAEQLAPMVVTIELEADPAGKLYGSVSPKLIADAITSAGCEVQKSEVKLPEGPIRQIGEHIVNLQLHSEVTASVTIKIVSMSA